jgi:hypothetical protein
MKTFKRFLRGELQMGKKLKEKIYQTYKYISNIFLGVFILLMIRRYLLSKNFNFDIINFILGHSVVL